MPESQQSFSRRRFIGGAAGVAAGAGILGALPAEGAEAGTPMRRRRGSLDDVKHVVVLMQENRSFDHYYGTMRGVRGLGDPAALRLRSGRDVFHQPDLLRLDGGYLLPFRVDTHKVDGQELGDLDHSWEGTHLAWANGEYNGWVLAKTDMTMSYFTGADIPFHHALAQHFTVCDNYFCSIQGPTTPNRLYHWTGTIDPDGAAGGPATSNPADYKPVYSWTTYPERLQHAGIDWQVYANDEIGDDGSHPYVGDYGDNPLWLFQAYHDALASADPKARQLAERASLRTMWKPDSGLGKDVSHVISQFAADCKAGTLPAVSWVVAPYGYSEHPAARPVDGEAYVQGVLNALWGNPELWESTVVFINYDENDGFFDHVIPPVAPPGTPHEFVNGLPIGLGPRVPMTVISPWSRGGWVNSQVFDHTSVLRFLETWTGVAEPNISAWRRSICGDLTSCFDFASVNTTIPLLPDTAALRKEADLLDPVLPKPGTPAVGQQQVPVQEAGTAPARATGYQPLANVELTGGKIALHLRNEGETALQLAIYPRHLLLTPARRVDLAAGDTAEASFDLVPITDGYDVWTHGPNGFLRHATGNTGSPAVEAALTIVGTSLRLLITNSEDSAQTVRISGLRGRELVRRVESHRGVTLTFDPLVTDNGWYDIALTVDDHKAFGRRFAGHVENGQPSTTG